MTEEQFRRSLRLIVDAHVSRLTCAHRVLSHTTAALMKVAREDGLSNELLLSAIDAESDRVDREMDQVATATAIAQSLRAPKIH